ncbi:MAG: M20 family metallopeptidase, partial [Ruminococcaceae bacterium]|nr:M20 family metallopeptidase [Oscillospiraceae bacterium]
NIRMDSKGCTIGIDIRFPVTADGRQILDTISAKLAEYGMTVEDVHLVDPIYMPEDEPLIRALCECYEQVSGRPAHVYATGGGTYARSLCGRGIAFGMEFPDSEPTRLHESNESFDKDELMQHAQICLAAMHRMMTM